MMEMFDVSLSEVRGQTRVFVSLWIGSDRFFIIALIEFFSRSEGFFTPFLFITW